MPPQPKRTSRKMRLRRSAKTTAAALFVVLLFFFTLVWATGAVWNSSAAGKSQTEPQRERPLAAGSAAAEPVSLPTPPAKPVLTVEIQSRNAFLCLLSDREPLYEKAATERAFPASLTKMMTAILAIESLTDLEETIEVPAELYQELYAENAALAGFLPGDQVRAIDLLYGTMLPSGAEAAESLAIRVGGSIDGFVAMMNQKAATLGMHGTHFVNVTGLHHPEHYSTAEDMARLARYALENPTFRELFTAKSRQSAPTAKSPEGVLLGSTLFQRASMTGYSTGPILGGKTGYTEDAGLCLASLGLVNGEEYLLITLGAPGDGQSEPNHLIDQLKIYENLAAELNRIS